MLIGFEANSSMSYYYFQLDIIDTGASCHILGYQVISTVPNVAKPFFVTFKICQERLK